MRTEKLAETIKGRIAGKSQVMALLISLITLPTRIAVAGDIIVDNATATTAVKLQPTGGAIAAQVSASPSGNNFFNAVGGRFGIGRDPSFRFDLVGRMRITPERRAEDNDSLPNYVSSYGSITRLLDFNGTHTLNQELSRSDVNWVWAIGDEADEWATPSNPRYYMPFMLVHANWATGVELSLLRGVSGSQGPAVIKFKPDGDSFIAGTGRLGIGTETPTTALDVVGTVKATSFSGSGSGLTGIDGTQITSGTVPAARLGGGTANSSTFLRGDGTWAFVPNTVRKTADESRPNNVTLSDDAVLKFTMAANTKYSIRLKIFFTTADTPDLKYRVTGPASPVLVRRHITRAAGGAIPAMVAIGAAYDSADVALTGTGAEGLIDEEIIVHNGGTAGDFKFQWAQNTSNGFATNVRAGSYLEYMQF